MGVRKKERSEAARQWELFPDWRVPRAFAKTAPSVEFEKQGTMDTQALRKARGAFFTPAEITDFLACWAVRSASDTLLEPSCGEAAFLLSAAARLDELGMSRESIQRQLHGIEIHESSARSAKERLQEVGFGASVEVANFFDCTPRPEFDAVVGNPPYVRYHQFSGIDRAKSLQAALAQGVRLTGLASSWAAFTIHAAQFLKPEGRLALVLPAELLAVSYAAQVRSFLLRRFRKIRLVLFEELVFPGVLEEIVLLLAEGTGGAPSFETFQAKNLAALREMDAAEWVGFTPRQHDEKWTAAILPIDAADIYRQFTARNEFTQLVEWGNTYLGIVTGNNDFFTLTLGMIDKFGLSDAELLPISPPGARHLRGLKFASRAWTQLTEDGKRCYLFAPSLEAPSPAARRYIEMGEMAKIHQGYKCRNRAPWWRVPLVDRPDLLFTYMNHDRPRLTTNDAGVHALNSLYGVRLKDNRRAIGRELLPAACLNSLTLLGGEMVGRAYGGGLLKHEPREADLLPVPSFGMLEATGEELRSLLPQVAGLLRSGDGSAAVEVVDRALLERHLGLSRAQVDQLRKARDLLFRRRIVRGRGGRGED